VTENQTVTCPYCGEPNELMLDYTETGQTYTEDCAVCCNPMEVRLSFSDDGELVSLAVERENPP
jgi:hypothetical protein